MLDCFIVEQNKSDEDVEESEEEEDDINEEDDSRDSGRDSRWPMFSSIDLRHCVHEDARYLKDVQLARHQHYRNLNKVQDLVCWEQEDCIVYKQSLCGFMYFNMYMSIPSDMHFTSSKLSE